MCVFCEVISPSTLKIKDISVTGCRGQWGCETSRFLFCLDNRLIDVGSIVSFMCRPRFGSLTFFCYSFLIEAQ
jgi:hypothetical protein